MEYFTVLTNIGAQKIAAANAANSTINLSEIAVGDGNGVVPVPDISQEALVNEKFRAPLSELTQDEVNKNHFIARSLVPADNGNFWIREIGVYDVDGDLIAVGNYPETYKSILTDGAAKEVDLIVVFEVANADVVKLEIDPSIVMASQDFVNQKVATKADKTYVDEELASIQTFPIGYPMLSYEIYDFTIVAFGGEFNRAEYPKLWAKIESNPTILLTESEWQTESASNDDGICGFFSSGDGSTTFRVPNLNEAFFRASNRGVGSYQADAFKSHNHKITSFTAPMASAAGGARNPSYQSTLTNDSGFTGDEETRPKNITLLPLIVAK